MGTSLPSFRRTPRHTHRIPTIEYRLWTDAWWHHGPNRLVNLPVGATVSYGDAEVRATPVPTDGRPSPVPPCFTRIHRQGARGLVARFLFTNIYDTGSSAHCHIRATLVRSMFWFDRWQTQPVPFPDGALSTSSLVLLINAPEALLRRQVTSIKTLRGTVLKNLNARGRVHVPQLYLGHMVIQQRST